MSAFAGIAEWIVFEHFFPRQGTGGHLQNRVLRYSNDVTIYLNPSSRRFALCGRWADCCEVLVTRANRIHRGELDESRYIERRNAPWEAGIVAGFGGVSGFAPISSMDAKNNNGANFAVPERLVCILNHIFRETPWLHCDSVAWVVFDSLR